MSGPRPCPACGDRNGQLTGTKNSYQIVRCSSCRTLHTAEIPAPEALHNLYGSYYGEANLIIPDFVSRRLEEIVSTFLPYRQSGCLLDIGFGAGTLMEAARGANWRVSGIDIAPVAVEAARGRGFDVQCGTLTEGRYPTGYFDVVIAVEVLEHLTEPLEQLQEIARVLRPGGLLWATTPHGSGISARVLRAGWSVVSPPEHIQLFSRRGAFRLLERAGFEEIRLATHGVNPYEIVSHFRGREAKATERVATSQQLHEALSRTPSRRIVKNGVNGLLTLFRIGDAMKIYART